MSTDRVQLHSMKLIEKVKSPCGAPTMQQCLPNEKEIIRTDLQIKLPEGCYGRIAPITDLATFHHISIGAGSSIPIFVVI